VTKKTKGNSSEEGVDPRVEMCKGTAKARSTRSVTFLHAFAVDRNLEKKGGLNRLGCPGSNIKAIWKGTGTSRQKILTANREAMNHSRRGNSGGFCLLERKSQQEGGGIYPAYLT